MGRKNEEMGVRLARALWAAGAEVPEGDSDRARAFYLAQSSAARSFLAEEIRVFAAGIVDACVTLKHPGSREATERTRAAACRVCGKDVFSLKKAANYIDVEKD